MKRDDTDTTIDELKQLVIKFCADRGWERHNTPKNLAMNIAIEAAELMEHYQWERGGAPDKEAVADEVADVLFSILNFAHSESLDLTTSFHRKYDKLGRKYPLELFNPANDSLEDYKRIRKAYRAEKDKS